MAYVRKIKAGLVPIDTSQFVGEPGTLFFDTSSGRLFLSDGVTPGGIPIDQTLQNQVNNILENVDPATLDSLSEIVQAFQEADVSQIANLTAVSANLTILINDEITRATSSENSLQANIDTEAATRLAEDLSLQANITAEESARISADSTLQSNIDAEAATRLAEDLSLQSNIDAEETARISADTTLQSNIDAEAATRLADDTTLQSNIDAEAATRLSEDLSLQSNITAEESARISADTNLQSQINNIISNTDPDALDSLTEIVTAFQNSDGNLITALNNLSTASNSAIVAEETARISADSTLQSNIDAEAATRLAEDTTLQNNIDTEAATRLAEDLSLQANITAEESARISADTTLQNNIDAEAAIRLADDLTLQSNIDAEASARLTEDLSLQANIEAEAGIRLTEDLSLQANIEAEATTRLTEDLSLQANIESLDSSLATVAKTGEYGDLLNPPNFDSFEGNIIPDLDNTRYLGSESKRWHTLYVGPGSIDIAGQTISLVDNKITISAPVDLSNSDIDWGNVTNKPAFSAVATSGSYNDLSGIPTALSSFTNDPGYQTASNVNSTIQAVVGAAPEALNTLQELAAALGDDSNFASNVVALIGTKADLSYVNDIQTAFTADVNLKANIADLSSVATSGSYNDLTNIPVLVSDLIVQGANLQVTKTNSVTTDLGSILGYTGSQGIQGETGFTGSQGIQGDVGFVGSQGIQGDVGFTGSQGDQGVVGFTGSQGDQGVIGYTGSQGIQGETGFVGSQGDVGFTGSQGIQGETGATGAIGVSAGLRFIYNSGPGFQDPGDGKFSVNRNSVGTFSPTTELIFSYQTADAIAVNTLISRWDDNTTQTNRGVVMISKADGTQQSWWYITGAYAVAGTGLWNHTPATFLGGNTAFTNGEEYFVTFVRNGDKGDTGATGATGPAGEDGIAGIDGVNGVDGYTGSQGDTGYTGSQGDTGVVGFTGSQGIQGDVGFTGSQGDQGVVGFTGSQGDQGVVGFTGSQGDQGVVGFTGSQGYTGSIGYTGSQGVQGPAGQDSSARYQFRYSTTTSVADPGAGYFRLNNSTMSSATSLYIDVIDYDPSAYPLGNDITDFLNSLTDYGNESNRGFIKIEKANDSTWYQQYIFSSVTNNSGWFTIGLDNTISDANFTDDDICYVSFILAGPAGEGVPAGGETGNVLIKSSGTDYDTEWIGISSLFGNLPGPYVNEAAAASDGVQIGQAYYDNGGTVRVRLT